MPSMHGAGSGRRGRTQKLGQQARETDRRGGAGSRGSRRARAGADERKRTTRTRAVIAMARPAVSETPFRAGLGNFACGRSFGGSRASPIRWGVAWGGAFASGAFRGGMERAFGRAFGRAAVCRLQCGGVCPCDRGETRKRRERANRLLKGQGGVPLSAGPARTKLYGAVGAGSGPTQFGVHENKTCA